MYDSRSALLVLQRGKRMRRASCFQTMMSSVILTLAFLSAAYGQNAATLDGKIQSILKRPEFAHATFGLEFYSLDSNQPVYRWNADKLMVPGSTTKLLTEGTLLNLLGPDYQFHTRVYRTGEIKNNTLEGDIVIVASGDPNLWGRIQPDHTLAYEHMDH